MEKIEVIETFSDHEQQIASVEGNCLPAQPPTCFTPDNLSENFFNFYFLTPINSEIKGPSKIIILMSIKYNRGYQCNLHINMIREEIKRDHNHFTIDFDFEIVGTWSDKRGDFVSIFYLTLPINQIYINFFKEVSIVTHFGQKIFLKYERMNDYQLIFSPLRPSNQENLKQKLERAEFIYVFF